MTSTRDSLSDNTHVLLARHMLIWKEWCEHRYILGAFTALVLIGPVSAMISVAFGLQSAHIPDLLFDVSCFLYAAVAGLALGLRTSAGERTQRTLPFLMALPIAKWQVVLTKLFCGVITLVLPLLISTLVVLTYDSIALPQNEDHWHHGIAILTPVMSCWWVLAIYAYTLACTARLVHEVNVVVAAFLGLVGAITLNFVSGLFPSMPGRWVFDVLLMAWPPLSPSFDWIHVQIQGILGMALVSWFAFRFGTDTTRRTANRSSAKATSSTMGPPWPTPQHAITWQALQKLRRIGQVGVILGVLELALVTWAVMTHVLGMDLSVRKHLNSLSLWLDLFHMNAIGWSALLIGGACLLATTTWHDDLQRGTVTFWRSRPIDFNRWFWTNYLVGFGLLTLGHLPAVAMAWCTHQSELDYILFALIAASYAMFALTTLFMVWVDRPLYAIILAVGVAACLVSGLVILSEARNSGRTFFQMAIIWFALPAMAATGGAFWVFQRRTSWNQ